MNLCSPTNEAVVRCSLAIVHEAQKNVRACTDVHTYAAWAAQCALFNATDRIVGTYPSPYASVPFLLDRERNTDAWHEALNIRTCSRCRESMHDSHAVPWCAPSGDVHVYCAPCALNLGVGRTCETCALVYPVEDVHTVYVRIPPTENYYIVGFFECATGHTLQAFTMCTDCICTRPT